MSGKLLGPKLEAEIRRLIQIENGRPTVSGMKRRNSRPSPVSIHVSKTTEAIASGATGEVEFYYGDKGEEEASGEKVDAYNRFGALPEDEWAIVQFVAGGWEIIGGGGGCSQNEIQQITIFGAPGEGTFDLYFNGTEVEIDYDATASEVQTALEAHPDIGAGNVEVTGGPFPNATVTVEFVGELANTNVPIMRADWTDLAIGGDDPPVGIGIIISVARPGAPNEF